MSSRWSWDAPRGHHGQCANRFGDRVRGDAGIGRVQAVHVERAQLGLDASARVLAIHPRTRSQMYSGSARWDEIGRVAEALELSRRTMRVMRLSCSVSSGSADSMTLPGSWRTKSFIG